MTGYSKHTNVHVPPQLTTYTQLLIQATVISRLDHGNPLLASLSAYAIQPLQLIQNAAAPGLNRSFHMSKFGIHVTSEAWLNIN